MSSRSRVLVLAGALAWVGLAEGTAVRAGQASSRRVDIVSVAGCLQEQPAGTWVLENATDPVKSSANAPTKKELPTTPVAGKNRFQLIGVGEFDLPTLKNQLVVVKGLHIVATPVSRLNVTSVTPAFPSCAVPAGK